MKTMNLWIASIALLGLIGCSFDKDNSSNNHRQVKEQSRLKAIYEPLVGLYKGRLTTATIVKEIELSFFIVPKESGKNSDGTAAYTLELKASFKETNPVGSTMVFQANYIPESGALFLTNPTLNSEGPEGDNSDPVNSIIATLVPNKDEGAGLTFKGSASSTSGPIGNLEFHLISTQSAKPNEKNERNERLYRQYLQVAGDYSGSLMNSSGKKDYDFSISLEIFIDTAQNDLPVLVGSFARKDDASGSATLNLVGRMDTSVAPPRLILTGTPRYQGGSSYKATFDGKFENDLYVGQMTSSVNLFEGSFSLSRKAKDRQ